jgi:hypothetical protein
VLAITTHMVTVAAVRFGILPDEEVLQRRDDE